MKTCNRCNQNKTLDQFFNDSNARDGKCPSCKDCIRERRKNPKKKLFRSDTHKECSTCHEIKPNKQFYLDSAKYAANGRHSMCVKCKDAATYAWREKNKDKYNETCRIANKKRYPEARLQRYGLTKDQHDEMLALQDNKCAICAKENPSTKRALSVDHNHDTDLVRGILCYGCNRLLKAFDDLPLFESLLYYLSETDPMRYDQIMEIANKNTEP